MTRAPALHRGCGRQSGLWSAWPAAVLCASSGQFGCLPATTANEAAGGQQPGPSIQAPPCSSPPSKPSLRRCNSQTATLSRCLPTWCNLSWLPAAAGLIRSGTRMARCGGGCRRRWSLPSAQRSVRVSVVCVCTCTYPCSPAAAHSLLTISSRSSILTPLQQRRWQPQPQPQQKCSPWLQQQCPDSSSCRLSHLRMQSTYRAAG